MLYRNVDFDNRATLKLSYQYSMKSFLNAKYVGITFIGKVHEEECPMIFWIIFDFKFYLWLFQVKKFAFGYHYMQPNETYHEPTRKFFRNEVFRIPIYEVLLLETIWQQCWVTDIQTFCKAPCRTLEYPWPYTVARWSPTPKLHRSEFRRAHFEKNFLVGLW